MTSAAASVRLRHLVVVVSLAVLPAPPAPAEGPRIPVSPTLTVVDRVSPAAPRRDFTVASLRELVAGGQLAEVDSGPVVVYGEHTGDHGVWRFKGVRVLDLVKLATGYRQQMDNPLHRQHKGLYLAAYASDGYAAVLSWSELALGPAGAQALVAWDWQLVKAPNAGAQPPFTGATMLVVPTDSFTGTRAVQALTTVELRSIGEPSK